MNLRDLAILMEEVLVEHNISWRYVSSRNTRTLILEDGTATVLTLRYARDLDNYLLHVTSIPHEGLELITSTTILYDADTLKEKIEAYAKC